MELNSKGAAVNWIPIGYVSKRRATRMGWISPWPDHPDIGFPCGPPVEEICSVSNCIARRAAPPNDAANVDPLDLYADAESAWRAVPSDSRADFARYAYRLWTTQFERGEEEEIDLWWEPVVEPLAASYVRLGWDAVVGGNGHSFGCSPLSCNSGADVVHCAELNRFCLVSDEQAALALARRFSIAEPEPGPYCVVEVWRDTTTACDTQPRLVATSCRLPTAGATAMLNKSKPHPLGPIPRVPTGDVPGAR